MHLDAFVTEAPTAILCVVTMKMVHYLVPVPVMGITITMLLIVDVRVQMITQMDKPLVVVNKWQRKPECHIRHMTFGIKSRK